MKVACLGIIVLSGCHRTESGEMVRSEVEKTPAVVNNAGERSVAERGLAEPGSAPEALPACDDSSFEFNLKGLAEEEVRARFGSPARRESFRVEERGGEFYVGIQHAYPTTERKNRDVPIEEWTWTSGDCILTVWFHRPKGTWEVLDDVYWHEDTAF